MSKLTTTFFALDIGTRSVVGLLLKEENEQYHVLDLVSIEHKERSMIDGQIHNIISVANVISQIKEILEERHGPLTKVSVAAAGRALKTAEGAMSINLAEQTLMTDEDIHRLELAAVQQAQQSLMSSEEMVKEDDYYCVGYSVLRYKLDDEEIGSLIDQAGQNATVEVIATFLPRVVVESLLAALKRSNLEMEALTLEPIAAIHVLIPPSMRRLNVALVDVGAGTSDIAITNENTIVAYGMVPVAGDEITEALSQHYLLDFPVAEQVKRTLTGAIDVTFTDILGFEQTIHTDEVIAVIQPTVHRLAQQIAEEIQRLNNQQSPQAVMIVGGGSLTPGLKDALCESLALPSNRVAVRGIEAIASITYAENIPSTPELVTPIGIAIAARRAPIHYMTVKVNEKTIRLFELKEMTVGDALLAANTPANVLYGQPGMGMSVQVNGQTIFIPGEHGKPSTITVNGQVVSTKAFIKDGDTIQLIPGANGQDATATVNDLIDDLQPIHFTLDGQLIEVEPLLFKNGKPCTPETIVQDRDEIEFRQMTILEEILRSLHRLPIQKTPIKIRVNRQEVVRKTPYSPYMVNGVDVPLSYSVKPGDVIQTTKSTPETVQTIAHQLQLQLHDTISVTFNGEPVSIVKKRYSIRINEQDVEDEQTVVQPGDTIEFEEIKQQQTVFSDVFAFSNFSLPTSQTVINYQLLKNGVVVQFNEPIFAGDTLELKFITTSSKS